MFQGDENLIVGARNGPPLAVGHGDGEMFLGSDAIALAPFTNSITYLEDGDWAVVRRDKAADFRHGGRAASSASASSRSAPASWSTRATTAISWKRKSMSSRK